MQGVREEKEYKKIKTSFGNLLFLPMTQAMHVHSAEIYRSLRKKGITIRKPIDCMIASVAIEYNLSLLHIDRDYEHIARHSKLKILKTKKSTR